MRWQMYWSTHMNTHEHMYTHHENRIRVNGWELQEWDCFFLCVFLKCITPLLILFFS